MKPQTMVASLSLPLPEDILKHKWAGRLDAARQAIDQRLTEELPAMLRARLLLEKERLRRLPLQYPWNRAEAFEKLRALVPDITEAEMDACEREGRIDFLYLEGEKRYFLRFHLSLMRFPDFRARRGGASPASPWLDPMIAEIRGKGSLARRITLEASIRPADGAFVPGTYRAWLPLAAESAQQSRIEVLAGDPDAVAAPDAPARTAYWQRALPENTPFTLRYRYDSRILYADPLNRPAPAAPLYPAALPPTAEDLAEDGTFIRFTPYLRALAAEVTDGADSQAQKAWRIYEFITTRVKYSFVRQYFCIDDLGAYCAVNLKGDCGLQALLFINLCRIAGIPARWQSGLSIDEDGPGDHDWAQFWLPGWGWLFADPSFGGGAYRAGAQERWRFYFGNLDPMRMAANRVFMAPLTPGEDFLRVDPFDSQEGEISRVGADLPFVGREVDSDVRLVEAMPIETL